MPGPQQEDQALASRPLKFPRSDMLVNSHAKQAVFTLSLSIFWPAWDSAFLWLWFPQETCWKTVAEMVAEDDEKSFFNVLLINGHMCIEQWTQQCVARRGMWLPMFLPLDMFPFVLSWLLIPRRPLCGCLGVSLCLKLFCCPRKEALTLMAGTSNHWLSSHLENQWF